VAYGVAHIDDIPTLEALDGCDIKPVRHHFGITGFGVNAWAATDAGERVINEHEEEEPDSDEELYVVMQGRAAFEIDGERKDAPAGTLVFVPPGVKRTAFAEEPNTTVLAIGGKSGKPYTVTGWELWYPIRKLYADGENEQVVQRLREIVAANPQYGLLFYNLACVEALTGQNAEAIEHLHKAIELSDQFREFARNDSDLDAIRDDPSVQKLLA
jgi:hypothetical protein